MEVDASGVGLSATLVQQQQDGMVWPIAYSSRTLQQHEKHRVTEMEALGVMCETLLALFIWTPLPCFYRS